LSENQAQREKIDEVFKQKEKDLIANYAKLQQALDDSLDKCSD